STSNPFSNHEPPLRSDDEHNYETIPMKPLSPPISRSDAEDDSNDEETTFTRPKNSNLKSKSEARVTPVEDLYQKLLSLQYANPYDFFVGLEAICSVDAEFKNYIKDSELVLHMNDESLDTETKQALARDELEKFRIDALQKITGSDTSIAEEDKTSNAGVWLNKKLQLITQQKISMSLSEDEKLRLTQALQKQFHLTELNLSAVTLNSPDALELQIEKLKQYDLKLIAQTYQEFSKIESSLPQYPTLIKEKDNETSSQNDEGFEDQSELEHFQGLLNFKLHNKLNRTDLQIEEQETCTLIELISKHIEPCYRKWGLIGANLDRNLVAAIADELNLEDSVSNELANKRLIVSMAINLLEKDYQLTDTLKARETWLGKIKLHYAATEEIVRLRTQVQERIAILEDMHTKKTIHAKEDGQREMERVEGILTEDKKIDRSTLGQPLPVYLPNACRIIEDTELEQQASNFTVQGGLFQRRDTLEVNNSVTYEQNLGNKKQQWSVTRTKTNELAYKTKWEHRWNPKSVTKKEVAFTQMIDAVQSFKGSSIIHFNFNNCNKQTEKKYRIFIRAYNELKIGPLLYCPTNSKIQGKTSEIEAVKEIIRKQLNLQTEELDTNTKNLQTLSSDSILEAETLKTSARIR
ncbi:MAG: hypothetical protein REH83_04340, partial [Rickettsiella sp.]|nr:hypothetical protein [Rickettsiella sp.]